MVAMMLRFMLAFLLALIPAMPAAAQQALQGSWAFQIEEAVVFRFDVEQNEDGEWSGTWSRPNSFRSNGVIFTGMTGSEQVRSMAGLEFAGRVELSFDDPRPGAIPDIFRLELTGEDTASLIYVGTQLPPYPLIRVDAAMPLGPFDASRAYHRRDAILEKTSPTDDTDLEETSNEAEPTTKPAPPASTLGDDFLNGL